MTTVCFQPTEHHAQFTKTVTDDYPGGHLIGPHIDSGPYQLVVISEMGKDTNWLAESAASAYTWHRVHWYDDDYGRGRHANVAVLPRFAADLISWHADYGDADAYVIATMNVQQQTLPGRESYLRPFATLEEVDDLDVATLLVDLAFGMVPAAAAEPLEAIVAAGHVGTLMTLINQTDAEQIAEICESGDEDRVVTFLQAIAAASSN